MNFPSGVNEFIDVLFALLMMVMLCYVLFNLIRNFVRMGILVYWGVKLDAEAFKVKEAELKTKWKSKRWFNKRNK